MTDASLTSEQGFVCVDCRNVFLQPPRCTTCGAEKLYDATTRQQAETIVAQERLIVELLETLRLAQAWLTGWASAEDELTIINRVIQKASSYERTAVE